MGPERDCFVGSNGWVWFASKDHPSWIISSCGFESSWYPLDVTRTSCSKVQLDKVAVLDLSTIVAHVGHGSVADDHGGASIIGPCGIQFSLGQKLVRKLVNILVLLARLDRVLNRIVDLFALSNRFLH